MVEIAVSIQIFTEKIQFCHMLKLIIKQLASIEKSRNDPILSTHVTEATMKTSSIISSLILHPSILFVFSSIKIFAQVFTTLKKKFIPKSGISSNCPSHRPSPHLSQKTFLQSERVSKISILLSSLSNPVAVWCSSLLLNQNCFLHSHQ